MKKKKKRYTRVVSYARKGGQEKTHDIYKRALQHP